MVPLPEVTLAPPTREAKSPATTEPDAAVDYAREMVGRMLSRHAVQLDTPWAVGHAMLAFGPDFALDNGTTATKGLYARYAETLSVAGEVAVRFPERDGAVRVEPHTDLVLKGLTEAGVPPDREVVVGEGDAAVTVRLADHYRTSLWGSWVDGDRLSYTSWNDAAWSLQALATWAPPGLTWTARGGHEMSLDAFTLAAARKLKEETRHLRQGIAEQSVVSKVVVKKSGQHSIWDYTCGGMHFVQGVATAVARGFGGEEARAIVVEEVDVLFYRWAVEMAEYDRLMESTPDQGARLRLLFQRLKFTGHFLETAHKLAAMGFYEPTEGQQRTLAIALGQTVSTIAVLNDLGVYDKLPALRKADEQAWFDLVGDSAHALRGIELAIGEGVVRY